MIEKYYGMGLSAEQYCILAVSKVPEQHREDEAGIRGSRWFDYRHMSPSEATYLFAACYVSAYREAYARTRDHIKAPTVTPFTPEDIFNSAELSSMWLSRRAADSVGCKYSFYLRFAFNRFADRGWKYLPRPNQLYSEELVMDARDAWAVECKASLQLANKSLYGADTGPGHDAYYKWVVAQIKMREHQHYALSKVVYCEGILPEHIAFGEFSEGVMSKAKSQYRNSP